MVIRRLLSCKVFGTSPILLKYKIFFFIVTYNCEKISNFIKIFVLLLKKILYFSKIGEVLKFCKKGDDV